MNESLEFAAIAIFFASFARWLYVHWRFWSIFRAEQPELSKELSGDTLASARGRGWVNFALEGKYRELGSERLRKAGDSLVKARARFQILIAIYVLAFAIWFGVSLLVYAR